jgi:quercetin dioxygenase-like cupin family protein
MRYEVGTVLNIQDLNRPVPDQVITEDVYDGVTLYSLAQGTDLPVQTNPNYHCYFVLAGKLNVYLRDRMSVIASKTVSYSQGIVVPYEEAVGCTALEGTVATEVVLGKKLETQKIKPMEVFTVNDLLAYQTGTAVRETVLSSGYSVLNIDALDKSTGLNDLFAEGELIVTCLDGEGSVLYGGKESTLRFGENFRVKSGTKYSLQAKDHSFKVSELIRIE